MLCPQSARAATSRAARGAARPLRLLEVWQSPCDLTLHFDLVDSLQNTLLKALRQGCVLKILGHLLAIFRGPLQKFDQLFALGRILLLLVNQQPRRACDWISVFAWRV